MNKNKQFDISYYQSLTRKMVLAIIIVSFTPMILVSGVILRQFHVSYREKVYAHLGEIVLKHKQDVDSFLNEKLSDIRFIAQSFTYKELSDESFLEKKLKHFRKNTGLSLKTWVW